MAKIKRLCIVGSLVETIVSWRTWQTCHAIYTAISAQASPSRTHPGAVLFGYCLRTNSWTNSPNRCEMIAYRRGMRCWAQTDVCRYKQNLPDAYHHKGASGISCCDTSTNLLHGAPTKHIVLLVNE